jgi:GNAT superfamily N-acetyltransferase
MSAYRFCRTDDIGLLVDALNRCWAQYFPGEPPETPATFKRSIRDLQIWCSSCMVAFAGANPVGVLIGAKRPSATLVHKLAVHPDHVRQGHGRHLLESLGSKLAILGPPRIAAEVPDERIPARGLFGAAGYEEEAALTDYVWSGRRAAASSAGLVIPITVDDLEANGLLDPGAAHQAPPACWERSAETLAARKHEIEGLAVATDEGLEAYLLYRRCDGDAGIAAFRSLIEDGGDRLAHLLGRVCASGVERVRIPKVHPAEIPAGLLEASGFEPAGRYRVLAATASQR